MQLVDDVRVVGAPREQQFAQAVVRRHVCKARRACERDQMVEVEQAAEASDVQRERHAVLGVEGLAAIHDLQRLAHG